MFIPKHFQGHSDGLAFIAANSFGQLMSHSSQGMGCTHLPMLPTDNGQRLIGHVARINPQAELPEGHPVLCVFAGPHGYVSPSWYLRPGVPTWNYEAAHVSGHLHWEDDAERAGEIVEQLTAFYEAAEETPWVPSYPPQMLNAIRAFTVVIERVEFKQKLSQNRSVDERKNVINAVRAQGNEPLAAAMEAVLPRD